jgi:hypothetical protein
MNKKEKQEMDDFILLLLQRDGNWACKDCSTENWQVWHRKDEPSCPKTGKPREECEDKMGE